jgi:predicted DNA-binding protein
MSQREQGRDGRGMVLSVRVDRETYDGFKKCVETEGQTASGSIRDGIESMLEAVRVRAAAAEAAAEKKSQEWPAWWPLAAVFGGIALARLASWLKDREAKAGLVGYAPAHRYLRRQATAGSGSDGGAVSAGAPDAVVATSQE